MTVWTVPATIVRVIDADTIETDLDLGWHLTYRAKIRLAGVNAPELTTAAGKTARAWLVDYLAAAGSVTVVSHSLDKYGRVLGDVYWWDTSTGIVPPLASQHHLNADLLSAGHAVPMGG